MKLTDTHFATLYSKLPVGGIILIKGFARDIVTENQMCKGTSIEV